jgi:hypothetical protein
MINHIRTLLLNTDGTNNPGPDFPGEEYVPPSFRARAIPASLQSIYYALISRDSDRLAKNIRLHQYMAILHASPLKNYVTALDNRITYDPTSSSLFNAMLPVVTTKQTAGTAKNIYVNSNNAVFGSGRLKLEWQVDVVDGTTVKISQYSADTGSTTETFAAYSSSSSLSSVLSLPGSELTFRFETGVGSKWSITVLAYPILGIPEVCQNVERVMNPASTTALFGRASETQEPYLSCRNTWYRQQTSHIALSGVILAMAYRLHEART